MNDDYYTDATGDLKEKMASLLPLPCYSSTPRKLQEENGNQKPLNALAIGTKGEWKRRTKQKIKGITASR